MSSKKGSVGFLEILKILVKRIRLSTLIMLIITLISSSFAWFIYATKVSTGITANIEAWSIKFTAEDNNIEQEVEFDFTTIFPGMVTTTKDITVYNFGDKVANVNYRIVSAKILGVPYIVDDVLTSAILENKLASDFPFKILLNLTEGLLNPSQGFTKFTVEVSWPYESGNDELDTYWGNKAYEFASNNPDASSIELTIVVSAVQQQE